MEGDRPGRSGRFKAKSSPRVNASSPIQTKPDRAVFLVITPGLVQAAREARHALHAIKMARAGVPVALNVAITFTRKLSDRKSEELRKLTQRDGTRENPEVSVLSPDGFTLHCPLEIYGLLDPACMDLIEQIVGANADGFLRVPRSVKQGIGDQLNPFDPISIASVVVKSVGGIELEPEKADELTRLRPRGSTGRTIPPSHGMPSPIGHFNPCRWMS